MVRLSKALYLSAPIVSIVASIGMVVGVYFALKGDFDGGLPYLVIGSAALLYSGVIGLIFYYKMWESIQDGYARTSPGKAVGFLFIPLFNFYWMFQVIWGYAKDYNAYVDRYGISTPKLQEGLFLTCCILALTTGVPFVNFVTIIAYLVVFVMVVSKVCDAVNALPAGGERKNMPVAAEVAGPMPFAPRKIIGPIGLRLALHCLSGEFANESLEVPADGISIGRDPARVNLVLAESDISGAHARVTPGPKPDQLWLEDLHSLNGTFYSQNGSQGEWTRLQGKILLSPGARFRLAVDGPEFEIRT